MHICKFESLSVCRHFWMNSCSVMRIMIYFFWSSFSIFKHSIPRQLCQSGMTPWTLWAASGLHCSFGNCHLHSTPGWARCHCGPWQWGRLFWSLIRSLTAAGWKPCNSLSHFIGCMPGLRVWKLGSSTIWWFLCTIFVKQIRFRERNSDGIIKTRVAQESREWRTAAVEIIQATFEEIHPCHGNHYTRHPIICRHLKIWTSKFARIADLCSVHFLFSLSSAQCGVQ